VNRFELYNLAEDPSESRNVMKEHPGIAEKMKQRLAELIENGKSRN
jgi:hypothetical protein